MIDRSGERRDTVTVPGNAITTTIVPRVSETDGCGHINNTVMPIWFEAGRRDIFEAIMPGLHFRDWKVAVVTLRVDYKAQTYLERAVTIRTWISKLGNKSITIREAAFQDERCTAEGEAVYVYFDYDEGLSKPVPDAVRERLKQYLVQ